MTEFTFSRFIYLDTNILSHFAKNEHSWMEFFDFLKNSGLTLGVGEAQLSELSDAKRLLTDLARFLVSVPSGILKSWDEIVSEEVAAHPNKRTESLLMYPLNAILLEDEGLDKLIRFLNSERLADARKDQLHHARQMVNRHGELKSNFPPLNSGNYDKSQADKFALAQVFQWLVHDHRPFLEKMQQNISAFNESVFQSIRLFAYSIFYKYYLGQREPNNLSDFGDLFLLFPIPYCEIVVVERDLANILNQIKNNQEILEDTEINNIDFVRRFE